MSELLVFGIEDIRYAVPVGPVAEVVRAVALSPAPPDHTEWEGCFNRRGDTVPVLNLRRRFGHPTGSVSTTDFLIVVESESGTLAIRAETVVELVEVDIRDSPTDLNVDCDHAAKPRGIDGVVQLGTDTVFLIDVTHLASAGD